MEHRQFAELPQLLGFARIAVRDHDRGQECQRRPEREQWQISIEEAAHAVALRLRKLAR
jgi:hypothetical protein